MAHDIFLSYARVDIDRVRPLVRVLQAEGYSVWWDPEINPGDKFDEVIEVALDVARIVVVVWSVNSVSSRWVKGEARIGAERGVLIPVAIDRVKPPIDLRTIHTADLSDWTQGTSAGLASLQRALRAVFVDKADAPTSGPPTPPWERAVADAEGDTARSAGRRWQRGRTGPEETEVGRAASAAHRKRSEKEKKQNKKKKTRASTSRARAKRRAQISELALAFHSGETYTERHVDAKISVQIAQFPGLDRRDPRNETTHLRRWLVDFGLLKRKRDGSTYWRP